MFDERPDRVRNPFHRGPAREERKGAPSGSGDQGRDLFNDRRLRLGPAAVRQMGRTVEQCILLVGERAPDGIMNVCAAGETSWQAFAEEIFRLARLQGMSLAVERVLPIATSDYPTPARRPLNSRLDLSRLRQQFGLVPIDWPMALAENFSLLKLVWEEEQARSK